MEHRLNRAISANSTSCRGFSQEEHGFQSSKQIGALPRPQWLQFLESWRGCTENQSNRFLCGGARLCGNTTGSANAAFLSRWVSILSMTTGSSIQAMTLTAPPHLGAGFYVDIEHPLQSLSPGHRCPALCRRLALPFLFRVALAALSSFSLGQCVPTFLSNRNQGREE